MCEEGGGRGPRWTAFVCRERGVVVVVVVVVVLVVVEVRLHIVA